MHRVLEPLAGMVVPCAFDEIEQCWRHGDVLARLAEEVEQDEVKLPPRHIAHGADGVRQDLESLSVFLRMRDGPGQHPGRLQGGLRSWPQRGA